jgi:hypothetical protein
MKKAIFLFLTFAAATIVFAGFVTPYNNTKPATLSLPDAYERALAALGPATNQVHCLDASVKTTFSTQGEWFFTFYSTNSQTKPKWVTVEFNGKVQIEENIIVR